jgi:hypothetical protein
MSFVVWRRSFRVDRLFLNFVERLLGNNGPGPSRTSVDSALPCRARSSDATALFDY